MNKQPNVVLKPALPASPTSASDASPLHKRGRTWETGRAGPRNYAAEMLNAGESNQPRPELLMSRAM
jgi:hypothetical protein